jgi:hypothetical protein
MRFKARDTRTQPLLTVAVAVVCATQNRESSYSYARMAGNFAGIMALGE